MAGDLVMEVAETLRSGSIAIIEGFVAWSAVTGPECYNDEGGVGILTAENLRERHLNQDEATKRTYHIQL